jgi:glycosyltransferase involved in cell wall biosynthesis
MFPPHHYGGYELFARDVLSRLRDGGDTVEVLTSDLSVGGGTADDAGLTVHRELSLYWSDHVILRPPVRARWRMERHNHRRLREHVDRYRPDVVSVWAMGCLSLGLLEQLRAADIPVVLVVCDDWLVYGPVVDGWMHLFSKRPWAAPAASLLTRLPTRVGDLGQLGPACFTSEATRATVRDRTPWRFPLSAVVYSGIDERIFQVADRQSPAVRPWRWRLAVVGRLDPRKGVDTAIRALPFLPDEATLAIVGPGDERELARLSALADSLGVDGRVHFEVVERETLPGRYREIDALIFPVTWDEPFGLVPIEAMACDTPVAATATGGSGEFLRDGETCVHFPPEDSRALAAALRRLAATPELRRRLVTRGRVVAAELTVANAASVLREWHEAAVQRFPDGPPAPRRTPAELLDELA